MSEQNPYGKLGVTEDSSFEEIQEAKNRLRQQHKDDSKFLESVEMAYDAIIMERLKLRQEGKIKVPDRIRFPEKMAEIVPNQPKTSIQNSPPWLQRLIDRPNQKDLLIAAAIFGLLAGITVFSQGNEQSFAFPLVLGVFANIFLINRKENKFGRSVLITLIGLLVGVGLGTLLANVLVASGVILPLAKEQIACLVSFGLFWLSSSFLR